MKHEMPVITEEKRQALIADCKAEISCSRTLMNAALNINDVATAKRHESQLQRQQIALASLEAEPVATRCRYHSAPQSNEIWLYIPQESYSPDTTGNYQEQPLYTAPPVPVMHPDKLRMDWLVSMCVEVRKPLRYGSAPVFRAISLTDEEDDYHATALREQIDEAIRAAGGEVKQ